MGIFNGNQQQPEFRKIPAQTGLEPPRSGFFKKKFPKKKSQKAAGDRGWGLKDPKKIPKMSQKFLLQLNFCGIKIFLGEDSLGFLG